MKSPYRHSGQADPYREYFRAVETQPQAIWLRGIEGEELTPSWRFLRTVWRYLFGTPKQ
jgi:hypothetical protein